MNNEEKLSLYIHIPFCESKCSYCDFVSYAKCEDKIDAYFKALYEQIENYAEKVKIDSIYIGGGTPSYVDEKYISYMMGLLNMYFNIPSNCEISIEANPNSLTYKKAEAYRHAGINRLSMGVQAIQDDLLRRIGRVHTHEDTLRALDSAFKAGFENINLDVMFSLPGQTLEDFEDTIDFVSSCGVKHISAYSLTLEESTPINQLYKEGLYAENDELDREMYKMANEFLTLRGYKKYEISNFALPGYECKHNMYCWDFKEYFGFGASAHSFMGAKRYVNVHELDDFILKVPQMAETELISDETDEELMADYIMLALRKTAGINKYEFQRLFNLNFDKKYGNIVREFEDEGLLKPTVTGYALTDRGFDYANIIMREFL